MPLTSDWHIHSEASCDCASLRMADLVREAEQAGIRDYGVTDHIHTPFNLPDLEQSRAAFLAVTRPSTFHFGVEVSCVSQWELDQIARGEGDRPVYGLRSGGPAGGALAIGISVADIRRLGIEYVVAGTHWPMYVPYEREAIIRDYHRQNMFLVTHPLVTIVAHPWWWMGHWQGADGRYCAEPWFDNFCAIPQSLHDEFAAAARSHGKAVEVNISALLLNPQYPEHFVQQYLGYLADLKAKGVRLSLGSDCHDAHYAIDYNAVEKLLATVGIEDRDFWRIATSGGSRFDDHG